MLTWQSIFIVEWPKRYPEYIHESHRKKSFRVRRDEGGYEAGGFASGVTLMTWQSEYAQNRTTLLLMMV